MIIGNSKFFLFCFLEVWIKWTVPILLQAVHQGGEPARVQSQGPDHPQVQQDDLRPLSCRAQGNKFTGTRYMNNNCGTGDNQLR